MPNLMDTVTANTQLIPSHTKSVRVCLTKKDLSINASAKAASKSERFYFVRVPTRKLPLLSVESSSNAGSIVIDVNSHRKRATDSGYVPKIVVLRGLKTLQAAKASDKGFCSVWMGEKAIKKMCISAADCINSTALQSRLQHQLIEKYRRKSSSPWVEEISASNGYVVYRYDGESYRQGFSVDKKTQEPTLSGEPSKAIVRYEQIDAASLSDILYGDDYITKTMNQEMLFDRINVNNAPLGAISYPNQVTGADIHYPIGSELSNPMIKTMLNVREALSIYLNALKDGMRGKGQLERSFCPVHVPDDAAYLNASREAEIAARDAHRKVNIGDFINWQNDTLSKKNTQTKYNLTASAYAYIGDRYDISTWHLRIDSPEQIKKSTKLVMECSGIPKGKRAAIQGKLKAMLVKARS